MNSPFPGMDPYLEQFWLDGHARLILYICDQLEDELPSSLIARVEERVVFETETDETRGTYPDVKISERTGGGSAAVAVRRKASSIQPVTVMYSEPRTETYINILEAGPGQRLVTVIEVLSLANKLAGEGQRQYQQKQRELSDTHVSLVEIDLFRRGNRVLSVPASLLPQHARTTYQVWVRRGWERSRFEVYPIPLQSSLPNIAIPLREKDENIHLDLQTVVHQAYRKGRYHLTIDYGEAPDLPLRGEEAKWARTLLKKGRKRKAGGEKEKP